MYSVANVLCYYWLCKLLSGQTNFGKGSSLMDSGISDSKKEAMRKKALGELGELIALKALVDNGFEKISHLNDTKRRNFPFADLLAEKDGKKYAISVKARNKFQKKPTGWRFSSIKIHIQSDSDLLCNSRTQGADR
jgi:hypothetical protein